MSTPDRNSVDRPSGRTFSRRAFGAALGAGVAVGAAAGAGVTAAVTHGGGPAPAGAPPAGPAVGGEVTAPGERPFRAATGRTSDRPNILFIFADDLGWADPTCYGSPNIRTPNIDRLAAQGLRFTDGYAGSSTCSPTRLSLYTGRYPGRLAAGLQEPIQDKTVGLPPGQPTLASLLRDAGYATSMIGKWHCGALPNFSPTRSGWDEFFGNFGGALEYYSKLSSDDGTYDLYEGETAFQDLRYYTQILTERTIELIGRDHPKPWLLNLNFTTPHWPWIADGDTAESKRLETIVRRTPPEKVKFVLAHLDGGSLDTYRKMVEGMDASIGQVLDALEKTGRARDTVVVFSSDNGGERFSYYWPFAGGKSSLLEGGIRVPNIVAWPARIDEHQVSNVPIFTPDWTATLLEVAGTRPDPAYPLDGVSLAGYLLRGEDPPARDLFWRQRGQRALRRGNWKYYRADTARVPLLNGQDVLVDVQQDPTEAADLARQQPALVDELRAAWEKVDGQLLPYPPLSPDALSYGG